MVVQVKEIGAFAKELSIAPKGEGKLSGMRVGVKDLFDIEGFTTGCGNPDWARTHRPATRNAPAVDLLLAGGATVVGKTHTDELAYSLLGINSHYGTPLNSAAPERIPGGSSSGSAAAVAAGIADIGLGTDTGGSIRIPASFCGLYGLRTTHGTVPLKGVMPLAPSFDTVGWLTRELDDIAKILRTCRVKQLTNNKVRIFIAEDIWERADLSITHALRPLLGKLEKSLGPIATISLSDGNLQRWREVFQICQAAEIWHCHGAWIERENPDFGPGVRERFLRASAITEREWQEARKERQAISSRVFGTVAAGVLLVPAAPSVALMLNASPGELDNFRDRALEMLCPAGLAGCPQLVVPAAIVDGAPAGLSIVGAPGSDHGLIELAARFEIYEA